MACALMSGWTNHWGWSGAAMRNSFSVFSLLACAGVASSDVVVQPGASGAQVRRAEASVSPGPVGRGRLALPEEFTLPRLDAVVLDGMRAQVGPSWLGPTRPVPAAIEGAWSWTHAGERVWRVTIRAPGVRALRVRFEGFSAEGQVWLYGNEWSGPHIGPYSGFGPHGDGGFWSEFVFGEVVTIEYAPTDAAGVSDHVPFSIASIAHIAAEEFPVPGKPDKPVGGFQPRLIAGCHLDVSCYPALEKRDQPSIARLYISRDDGTYRCTGFLINPKYSSESRLLLLTAGHCVSSQEEAEDISLLWNYQTEECYGSPNWTEWEEPLAYSYGAQLVVAKDDEHGDFALLVLSKADVRSVTGWRARGWTTGAIATGEQVATVSHPEGSYKRAAIGGVVDGNWRDSSLQGVQWRLGTVEPGSSGSPALVFNSEYGSWIVVGVIVGVSRSGTDVSSPWGRYCDADLRAAFDPLSRIYETIQPYMESETALEEIAGDDHGDEAPRATSLAVGESAGGRIEPADDTDYFRLEVGQRTAVRIFTTGSLDTVGSLRNSSDEAITSNDDSGQGLNFLIRATLEAGTSFVRVRSFGQNTGSYTLYVERATAVVGSGEYERLEGWTVAAGTIEFSSGGASVRTSGGCSGTWRVTVNSNSYVFHNSKWQRRVSSSSAWADIPGTFRQAVCSYLPYRSGEYRAVAEISINGQRNRYATENILTWP